MRLEPSERASALIFGLLEAKITSHLIPIFENNLMIADE